MNSPMRMSEDCISLALDQRGRVLLRPKSEQCRKHRVVSQPVDVDVPRKSADDRKHGRADDVAYIGSVSFCGWLFLCNSKHTMFRGSLFSFTHWVKRVRFFLVEPKSCFHAGDFVARRGRDRLDLSSTRVFGLRIGFQMANQ